MRLTTSDGVELAADLLAPSETWAGAVLCHPHPAYGGDRHNPVVDRLYRALPTAGVTALRFDFRPDAEGDGSERADILAGVEQVATHLSPDLPLWLIGYSFGADLALSVGDERVTGWVAVAPPLRFAPPPRPAVDDRRPTLIVAAEHDQITPPDHLRKATAGWPDTALTVLAGTDHFLAGAADRVTGVVLDWLRDRTGDGPATDATAP